MSHLHKPCCYIRLFYVDLHEVAWKIRQKMSMLNAKLIDLNIVSGMQYFMYIDRDNVLLLNATYDKILFTLPVSDSFAVLSFKLDQILEMHRLEQKPFATIYERNHYYSLKKIYNYE